MDLGLKGKRALVTGGAQGIGREISALLRAEGAEVAIADFDGEAAAKTAAELGAHGFTMDVTSGEMVEDVVARVLETLGGVDVLINNAGGQSAGVPFLEMTPEQWQHEVDRTFFGVLNCCRAILPPMVKQGSGRIVNVGSDAARVGEARMSVYAGAKSGIIGFTKSLAKEVGGFGITVNVVCPGTTKTRAARRIVESPDILAKVVRRYPLGRLGEPSDIANAVIFMASERASWITGQTLSVSGGYSMM